MIFMEAIKKIPLKDMPEVLSTYRIFMVLGRTYPLTISSETR